MIVQDLNHTVTFVCSPLSGDVNKNIEYAKAATRHTIELGEVPFTPHLLYPQVLDDLDSYDRLVGMLCGLKLLLRCDKIAVYSDNGVSQGMSEEITFAKGCGVVVEVRHLHPQEDENK